MSAREIVYAAGMNGRPEFYSGRGATTSDLNSRLLEKIFNGIVAAHGNEAGANFVQMVVAMKKLSATDFLLTLYGLESNGWKWENSLLSATNGIYADDVVTGMCTIFDVMSGQNERNETAAIRGEFLRNHGIGIARETNYRYDPWTGKEYYWMDERGHVAASKEPRKKRVKAKRKGS